MLENTLTRGLTSSSANPAASYVDIGPNYIVSDSTEQNKLNGSPKLLQTCTYRAYNGKWCVYKLEKRVAPEVGPELNSITGEFVRNAWFICHGDISPVTEPRNLIYHGYFGDEIIRSDGMKNIKYPKPIEYHRLDFSGREWKSKGFSSQKYGVSDVGGCEGSRYMMLDGDPGEQTCILGFARADAVKSFLLIDNDCDPELLYFSGTKFAFYAMPWTSPIAVDDDENDSKFFILTRREALGVYETSKHRYVNYLYGEPFATMPVYSRIERKESKRTKIITSYFFPAPRSGTVAALPPDIINPHLLKFLTVHERLPLMGTCKYLNKIMDPYQFACLLNTMKSRHTKDQLIPAWAVVLQDSFLVRKASTSDAIVQSLFKNKVMNMWKGGEISYWRSSHYLTRQIVKGYIRNNRASSLKHIISIGRIEIDDYFYAVRQHNAEAAISLSRPLAAIVQKIDKCARCRSGAAVFFCRRLDFEESTTHEEDEGETGLCMACHSPEHFCELCDKYECDECTRTYW